jgi:hypothetical protein
MFGPDMTAGEGGVVARDHGRPREPGRHLLGHVRARHDRDRAAADERREPVAGLGVEALGQAEQRRRARQVPHDRPERAARQGDHDQVGVRDRRLGERHRGDVAEVDLGKEARVVAGRPDRGRVVGMVRGERDGEAAVCEEAREPGPPRAAADDEGARHDRRLKSIATGTPSRPNRSRSSFSTQ